MSNARRLGIVAAVLLIPASVVLGILWRRPLDVQGNLTNADVEISINEKNRQFDVGLTGIEALRLPVYEVDVDDLQGASIEYLELGASAWSQIPGRVTWLNIVPKPEGSDSQPGIFIRSQSGTAGTQRLNLLPNSGSVETLKFSSRNSSEILVLSGVGLSLAGQLHLSSASPSNEIRLEVKPTTGYLTLQYINAARNEPRNLSQITAMRLVQERDAFHVDLRPAIFSQWDFGFTRDTKAEAAAWSLRFDKPLRVVTLLCKAKSGKMRIGNGNPEEVINPTDLELVGTALNVVDEVKADFAGITLVLNGEASTVTQNKRDVGIRLLFRDVKALLSMVVAAVGGAMGLLAAFITFRTYLSGPGISAAAPATNPQPGEHGAPYRDAHNGAGRKRNRKKR